MIDGFTAGTLKGLSLIGWGADYPDPSNFLDYHFGSGSGKKFGTPFQDIVDALNKGLATADPAARTAAYATANSLIKQHVPAVIIAHGASGAAFKADVTGAYASVFGGEQLRPDAGRPTGRPSCSSRTPSRSASSAPTSRTARASARASRPTRRSIATRAPTPCRPSPPSARRAPTPRPGPASSATA